MNAEAETFPVPLRDRMLARDLERRRVQFAIGRENGTQMAPQHTLALPGAPPYERAVATAAGVSAQKERVQWLPLAALKSHVSTWQALADNALEPNVFYEPGFALAAAEVFGRDAGAFTVWAADEPRRLIGLFPARTERRYGFGPRVLVGWTHPYAPLGLPLVDRTAATAAIGAWLDHLADADLPRAMLLPLLPEGAFADALRAALARRGGQSTAYDEHRRALIVPGPHRADYLANAVGKKVRKELARKLRRVGDQAQVAFTVATAPDEVHAALDEFFALEAAGWKGRRGTAADRLPAVRAFMRQAAENLVPAGKVRIDRLTVDGRAIAATLVLRSGDTVWGWKTAYDEDYARTSPGVQIMCWLTEALLADPSIARVDSCAAPDHPMIDHLWRERLVLGDLMFTADPRASSEFALATRLETMRRRLIGTAKVVRNRLRRKKPSANGESPLPATERAGNGGPRHRPTPAPAASVG